jgi:hypothetical protein
MSLARHFDRTLMLLDYCPCHSEPQSKARLLGGKVGLEDFPQSLFADTDASVAERYLDAAVELGDASVKMTATGHRLKRIDREVRETGFQPFAVTSNHRWRGIRFKRYFNSLLIGLRSHERNCVVNQFAQVDCFHCQSCRPAVIEQITHKPLQSRDFVSN